MAEMGSKDHTEGPGPQTLARRNVAPFGKYLLLERISVGGMAEVYKAKAFGVEGFEKILAIKRILPTIAEDEEFINMFIDEAKIVGQLSHANICQVLELGRIGDSHFIAMEYIWGRDLLQIQNHFRRQNLRMPVPMAVFIISKVCEGLDYAHRKRDSQGRVLNIVHRDVSPQNILVAYEGAVKIIDFGIARAAYRQTRTQAGVLKGKFGYMSPEQVRGMPIDRRSDLFAVGTLLYELLTAERLFLGESDFSTLDKVRSADVEPPTKYNASIPPDLERIIMKALAREPENRWQWASELQEALQRCLINFKPVYTAQKLAIWMKENFSAQITRDKAKMEEYARIGQDALQMARKSRNLPPPIPGAHRLQSNMDAAIQPKPPIHPNPPIVPRARPLTNVPEATKDISSPGKPKSSGENVSLNQAEMDWLMRDADDDDMQGESTVIADMDFSGFDLPKSISYLNPVTEKAQSPSTPAPGLINVPTPNLPNLWNPELDDDDDEEATAIYFVNEKALLSLEDPVIEKPKNPADLAEQPTQLVDSGKRDDSVAEQSTLIFDEASAHEDAQRASVSIRQNINIGNSNTTSTAHSTPPTSKSPPSNPSPSPLSTQNKGNMPSTLLLEPGQVPHEPQPQSHEPSSANSTLTPLGNPPPDHSSLFSHQNRASAPSATTPLDPNVSQSSQATQTSQQTSPTRHSESQRQTKTRSSMLLLIIVAIVVIVLGGMTGVVIFVVTSFTDGSSVSTQDATGESSDVNAGANLADPSNIAPENPSAPEIHSVPIPVPPHTGVDAISELPPETSGLLLLEVIPEDAVVEINGSPVSRSIYSKGMPLLAEQEHTIRASAPNHQTKEVTLTVRVGQEKRKTITLEPQTLIEVDSTPPGAKIRANGRDFGVTPTKIEDVKLGRYTIYFSLKDYKIVSKRVNLTKDAPRVKLNVKLIKARITPPITANLSKEESTPSKTAKNSEGGVGFLVVSTQPWGRVFVDGRDTGRDTPILPSNPLRLSAGSHRLTIRTNNGQRFTFPVNIVAGETRRFMRRLDAQ